MHEIVEFCRAKNIFCQGRGSAANSTVCYSLGITAVDPVRMGLLFERFLSRERAEPPDIDLDIEHERREEVIQHVYAKYGRTHAAMVANVISYRGRSALRDVGKALGFSETVLARLANQLSHWEEVESDTFSNAGLGVDSSSVRLLCELANEIEGFPRHLSIHPGGFLLGHEPVSTLVPIENATMEARTVIQWDKDDVEALGLFKVDLLGLGALTHLHRCFDLVRAERGRDLSIATIPADDEPTFEMIRKADTIGVFQIESRAQMSMLPRLRPKHYYDLVIEVSIVRPGPISGGMVHPYLRRRNGEEPVIYPHECLRPVLEKTLGVPLFQEQVMRLAVVAADYTPGEADQLRRDMAAWHKNGRIEQHRERLVTRMQKKGIAPEFAERVYQQILGFGEYGFPESHAASFAIISYAGAWLKRHYPTEFTCALLNAQPMGFYSIATIIDDAKRHGVIVRPIDVLHSRWDCTVEMDARDSRASDRATRAEDGDGTCASNARAHDSCAEAADRSRASNSRALRIGLRYVKSLGLAMWEEIERAAAEAPFTSLDDFQKRVRIPRNALESLAAAGAFESLERSRRTSLWKAYGATSTRESPLYARELEKSPVFEALSELETITWDYESSSHSVRGHPLAPMRADLEALGLPDARTVAKMRDGEEASYAGLVICRQRPGTASGVTFMTLEDETGLVNLILKLPVFERYAVIAKTQNFLGVTGLVQAQDGVVHILVDELWKPETRWQPVQSKSRDFH
jgi:error-prone DNA polymerase